MRSKVQRCIEWGNKGGGWKNILLVKRRKLCKLMARKTKSTSGSQTFGLMTSQKDFPPVYDCIIISVVIWRTVMLMNANKSEHYASRRLCVPKITQKFLWVENLPEFRNHEHKIIASSDEIFRQITRFNLRRASK